MPITKHALKTTLLSELPGKIAHNEIAPYRSTASQHQSNPRLSSILLLISHNENKELQTTLIKRSKYEGVHSGQIGFPGGKMEENDGSIIETALREANEEIGINQHEVEILGKLTDVFIPVSNFIVSPIVGWMDKQPLFRLNYREVEDVINLSVKEICQTEIVQQHLIQLNATTKIKVPCFIIKDTIIWGATALMLNEFKHICNRIL